MMSNVTQDVEFAREVVQGFIIQNYIGFATLTILVHDTGKPSLISADLSLTVK